MKKKVKRTEPVALSPDGFVETIRQLIQSDLEMSNEEILLLSTLAPHQLYSGVDVGSIARFRLISEFNKKYISDGDKSVEILEAVAKRDFISRISNYNRYHFHQPSGNRVTKADGFDDEVVRIRSYLHHILGELTEDEWFDECKHSSGSSIGCPYQFTDIDDKWTFPLSVTREAIPIFNRYLHWAPNFHKALLEFNGSSFVQYHVVDGSRFTTVEKDDTKRRSIAVEPTVNMFLQQGLQQLMRNRLRPFLDLEKLQSKHRILARDSSVTLTNATVDFSNASDSVLRVVVKSVLTASWWNVIDSVSCKEVCIDKVYYQLPMVGTMGNAITFPLETLLFYAMAVAVAFDNIHPRSYSTLFDPQIGELVSVYGDDVILPDACAPRFLALANYLGFQANDTKTFYGVVPFRESCGADYCSFRNVRPYNIRRPEQCNLRGFESWLYVILNRLLKWYISYYGPLTYIYHLDSVISYVAQFFVEHRLYFKIVPFEYPEDSGLHSHDWQRMVAKLRSEGVTFSSVSYDHNGIHYFSFLRFKTRKRDKEMSDHMSYFTSIKTQSEMPKENQIKGSGKYVVNDGISSRFDTVIPGLDGKN